MEGLFGVGPLELMLVFFLALIFIGPGKMPEVAASLGKAIREFQRASAELTDALNAEIAAAQAEKAAALQSGNGKSAEVEVAEAEVVAQAAPAEVAPVAYASAPEPTPPAEPVLDSAGEPSEDRPTEDEAPQAEPQPTLDAAPAASIVDEGEPFGLAPLPSALLAPSLSADGNPTVAQPVAPEQKPDDPAASATDAPASPAQEARSRSELPGLAPLPSALLAPSISSTPSPLSPQPSLRAPGDTAPAVGTLSLSLNGAPVPQSPAPAESEPESAAPVTSQGESVVSARAEVDAPTDGEPAAEPASPSETSPIEASPTQPESPGAPESPVEGEAPVDETARERAAAGDAVQAEV